ncbi:LuxR family transcriptional regulator [Streptomyces sp. NPDC048416]|uniref:helix-turn-helix transcriptional regulator n=1 Tax=Streptomyces sp. NPDC048416 TaxID=3365546 RepID=UPI003716D372
MRTEEVILAQGKDEMERSLLEVRSLIDSIVSSNRFASFADRSLLVQTTDGELASNTLRRLLEQAKESVRVILPSHHASVQALSGIVQEWVIARSDHVRVETLCSPEVAERHRLADYAGRRGVEIRLSRAGVNAAAIVDGRVALIQAAPDQGFAQSTLIRAPAVVRALNELFTSAWQRAYSLAGYQQISALIRQGLVQEILRCLYEGHTDEAAARELSVSVRTYRRHVAEIIRSLGASSRFQAGAQAVESGLLNFHGDVAARG